MMRICTENLKKINALYGMMVTDIIKSPFIFDGVGLKLMNLFLKKI